MNTHIYNVKTITDSLFITAIVTLAFKLVLVLSGTLIIKNSNTVCVLAHHFTEVRIKEKKRRLQS